MNRNGRVAAQFILFCLFISLVHRFNYHPAKVRTSTVPGSEKCRLTSVMKLDVHACAGHGTGHAHIHEGCRWDIRVSSLMHPSAHRLVRTPKESFSNSEVELLQKLEGCYSANSCENKTVSCMHGSGDLSDALWLPVLEEDAKFVVFARICFASLLFFMFAILCDGTIINPTRPGSFAISSALQLAMVGFASLLYILVVPRHMQFALYGSGFWQSIGYMSIVLLVAASLPGIAIIWISCCVLVIYFFGFLVEQTVSLVAGVLHFFGALSLYQIENALFQLRLIYNPVIEDESVLDRRLLEISQRFLRRVQGNFFLYRIARTLEQDAIQVVENTLPNEVFDGLAMGESIPEIDMEDLENPSASFDGASNVDSRTPLLHRSLPP